MVEFALSLPFLLLILLAIIYFGRYYTISQTLLYAAQEGAHVAARTANLSQDTIRASVRGFSVSGAQANTSSVIFSALASARLLSQGNTGNLPAGSQVKILPWDSNGTTDDIIPPGTIEVRIDYPFQLVNNPFGNQASNTNTPLKIAMSFNGSGTPVTFFNLTISQRAVAAQEIYQN